MGPHASETPSSSDSSPFWSVFRNVFYFNATTEASSYEHPYDVEYQKIYSVLSQVAG